MKTDMAEAYRWWTLSEMSGLEVASGARRQLMRIIAPIDLDRGRSLVNDFRPIVSTFRDDGVAAIQADTRMTDETPTAFGAGFIVSGAGHEHCRRQTPGNTGQGGSLSGFGHCANPRWSSVFSFAGGPNQP
jgi:hypothetical protein